MEDHPTDCAIPKATVPVKLKEKHAQKPQKIKDLVTNQDKSTKQLFRHDIIKSNYQQIITQSFSVTASLCF